MMIENALGSGEFGIIPMAVIAKLDIKIALLFGFDIDAGSNGTLAQISQRNIVILL